MPRLPSFLKSSKKNANKENVPSKKATSEVGSISSGVYAGERQLPPRITNPYDVVSAPKVTRPARSWAGGPSYGQQDRDPRHKCETTNNVKPFTDRQSNGNSSMRHYENLQRNTQQRSTGPISSNSNKYSRTTNVRHGSFERKSDYYDDCESDEDDICEENEMLKQRVYDLENELLKITRDYRELRQTARNYEKDLNHYSKEFDKEMSHGRKLSKKLKAANDRVKDLESQLSRMNFIEFYNNMNSQMLGSVSGAGEALCGSEPTDSRELTNSDTPSVMFGGRLTHDDQDEVRVFRTLDDISDGDLFQKDGLCDHFPITEHTNNHIVHTAKGPIPRFNRSMSDTDVHNISMTPEESSDANNYTSSWDRGTVRYSKNKSRYRVESEVTSDTSSEDGRAAECYNRQLKKKGEGENQRVLYKPPRRPISEKYYKRYGKNERTALAELEFLHDMSSDYSHLQSSPDVNRHIQFQLNSSRRT